MKQPKKLTRAQKEALQREGHDPKEWMLAIEGVNTWAFIKKDRSKTLVLEKR